MQGYPWIRAMGSPEDGYAPRCRIARVLLALGVEAGFRGSVLRWQDGLPGVTGVRPDCLCSDPCTDTCTDRGSGALAAQTTVVFMP